MGLKQNEVLILATTLMNLENIIVSENQSITKDHILDDPMYMKCPD